MADLYHYTSLTLENVRAFAQTQTLELMHKDGKPARWCVIVGDNGAGKTTLMHALAVMRPKPAFARNKDGQINETGDPDWIEPELTALENDQILTFVRHGQNISTAINSTLRSDTGVDIELGIRITVEGGKLASVDPQAGEHKLAHRGPLLIPYHGSRHAGGQLSDLLLRAAVRCLPSG